MSSSISGGGGGGTFSVCISGRGGGDGFSQTLGGDGGGGREGVEVFSGLAEGTDGGGPIFFANALVRSPSSAVERLSEPTFAFAGSDVWTRRLGSMPSFAASAFFTPSFSFPGFFHRQLSFGVPSARVLAWHQSTYAGSERCP